MHHPKTHRRRRFAGGLHRPACVGLILAVALVSAGCSPHRDPTVAPTLVAPSDSGVTTQMNLTYSDEGGEDLQLDACLPKKSDMLTGAVILLHGGGFTQGSRSDESMQSLCLWLARSGYAAFPMTYRLAPKFIYPSQTDDLAAAVEWLRAPEQVAQFNIDPRKIGALGSSAGAILTLQEATAGDGPTDTGSRLAAAVSLSGVADMTSDAVTLGTPSPDAVAIILNYLGCDSLETCDGTAASPITAVDATDPPTLLVGSEDDLVPIQQSQALAAAFDAVGVPNQVIVVPGSAHGAELMNQDVRDATLAFLDQYL